MTTPAEPRGREHHLDALRGAAMLLGIAMHAAVAYAECYGAVADPARVPWLRTFISGVHGFRMQLFFLLAGYFTALIAHRRGLRGLLVNRVQRLLGPLLLAAVTVLPAMALVHQQADQSPLPVMADHSTPPLSVHTSHPLHVAVVAGDIAAVNHMLARGQPVEARDDAGRTALHEAAYWGRADIATRLIAAGADRQPIDAQGARPADLTRTDRAQTLERALAQGRPIAFAAVNEGRTEIRRQLTGAGDDPPPSILTRLKAPLLEHLWFLWFLWLYVVAFAGVRRLARPVDTQRLVGLPWLLPATMAVVAWMYPERVWDVGAPTSTALLPDVGVLAYYGLFFASGALAFTHPSGLERAIRRPGLRLLLGALAFPIAFDFVWQRPWTRLLAPDASVWRLQSIFWSALYAWALVTALPALFRRWLARPRPAVRYLADASYWAYLVHLPVVAGLQLALRSTPLPGLVKYLLVLAGSLALLLGSYALFVRRTWIGRLLNGPAPR